MCGEGADKKREEERGDGEETRGWSEEEAMRQEWEKEERDGGGRRSRQEWEKEERDGGGRRSRQEWGTKEWEGRGSQNGRDGLERGGGEKKEGGEKAGTLYQARKYKEEAQTAETGGLKKKWWRWRRGRKEESRKQRDT